jgi:hypothetical protein
MIKLRLFMNLQNFQWFIGYNFLADILLLND